MGNSSEAEKNIWKIAGSVLFAANTALYAEAYASDNELGMKLSIGAGMLGIAIIVLSNYIDDDPGDYRKNR